MKRLLLSVFFILVTPLSNAELPPGADNWPAECEQGKAKSCLFQGFRFMNGDGVEKDTDAAMTWLHKACLLKLADGCHHAGFNLYFGKGNLERHQKGAIVYLANACKLGYYSKNTCYYAAEAMIYAPGSSAPAKDALYFANLGCRNRDAMACGMGAWLHSGQRGLPRQPEDLMVYAKAGCQLGDGYACYQAANAMGFADDVTFDPDLAKEYALKAWELNPSKEHGYLAGMIHTLRGEYEASLTFFKPLCEKDYGMGCLAAGNSVRHLHNDLEGARDWYQKGCQAGDKQSCKARNDLDSYFAERDAYQKRMAAWEAKQERNKEAISRITAALQAGDVNQAMELATYGIGSREQAARVLIHAQRNGQLGQMDPIYFHATRNWFVFSNQTADGIVSHQIGLIKQREKESQNRIRTTASPKGPQAPDSLYRQHKEFSDRTKRENLQRYIDGGRPPDPSLYRIDN